MGLALSLEEHTVKTETHAEQRDQQLATVFARLAPDCLEGLDEVWQLCAADLHGLALWRTGSTQDAEDVLQEVFIRLVRAVERGQLGAVRRPIAYLLRIAHSAAIDLLRQRRRHQGSDDSESVQLVEADADRAAEASRLSRHLSRLPEQQRAVVYLKHFSGLSFREIGKVVGVPTFTAASRYRLALSRLRRFMGVEL